MSEIQNPDAIQLSMTLTMTLGEWKALAEKLQGGDYWPCGKASDLVRRVIAKATANVTEIAREE